MVCFPILLALVVVLVVIEYAFIDGLWWHATVYSAVRIRKNLGKKIDV